MTLSVEKDTQLRFLEAFHLMSLNEPFLERVKMAGCVLESIWPDDLPGVLWYDLKKSLVTLKRPDLDEEMAKVLQIQWFKIFKQLV